MAEADEAAAKRNAGGSSSARWRRFWPTSCRTCKRELVQCVLKAMPVPRAALRRREGAGQGGAGNLLQSVASVHAGQTQKEILRALLDSGSAYCARIALFVVKAGAATGWQSRGFADDNAIKDFSLEMNAGPVAHAYQNRAATPANVAEMGGHFVQQFGAPANEQILMLPLVLKDKVAALVYADGGASGALDSASLELLVMATGAWLEVVSLRKQASKDSPRGGACSAGGSGADGQFVFRSVCGACSQARGSQRGAGSGACGRSGGSGGSACGVRGGSGGGGRSLCATFSGRCGDPSQGTALCPPAGG